MVLEAIGLRLGDPTIQSLLTHLATGGRSTYPDLVDAFAVTDHPPPTLPASADSGWLASLARVLALQNRRADDRRAALGIYRYLHARGGVSAYGRHHAKLHGDLLLHFDRDRELATLLTSGDISGIDRRFLVADLHNPWRGGPLATDAARWLREFEVASDIHTEPPLQLRDRPTPFDGLVTSRGRPAIADGLISVIMPVFRPTSSLRTSVESLLLQSWEDIEVIILDDGSGPDHRDIFAEVAAMDARVRLVHRPQNAGTYGARNAGLALARGRFVTFQDYDDWSHPRRLELQARPLLEDRSLVATHSRCARVNESLAFVHLGYHPLRHNASSLMIRRREVLLGVGYFDEVRKGGDSEYHERIMAHFGSAAVDDLHDQPVLAAVRRLDDSLSRSDFRAGWHHPDRVWYRQSYRRWHARVRRRDLFIDRAATARSFTAPRAFHQQFSSPPVVDAIVVSDWQEDASSNHAVIEWCRKQHHAGARLGFAHLDSIVDTMDVRKPFIPEMIDLVHDGVIAYIGLHEQARTQLAVVTLPSALSFTSTVSAWEVEGVALLDDFEAPVSVRADGAFDRHLATDVGGLVFGSEPVWRSLGDVELSSAAADPGVE